MQSNAEEAKPSFAANEFTNIGTAGYGVQPPWPQQQLHLPPPPAYTPSSAPPDYYNGVQNMGALQYGAPVHNVNAPSAPAFGQPAPSQNVQVNMVSSAAPPPTVIVAQMAPVVVSPPSYLGWSIFNCLCCFWPLGLAAIIYSVKVGSASSQNEAKRHSLTARNLNVASTTIAPIIAVIIVGTVLVAPSTDVRYNATIYYSNGYVSSPEYYASGYYYYYSKLVYYSYYTSYSYLIYSGYGAFTYSYYAIGYTSTIGFKYASDWYYTYKAVAYYG